MSEPILRSLVIDDDDISRQIIGKYIEKSEHTKLVGSYGNAADAANALVQDDVDILFLDVEMPEISGLELLKNLTVSPYIILTTAKKEYALDAFEYDVTDYLLKPIMYPRFLKAVSKAIELMETAQPEPPAVNTEDVFVKHNSRYVKVPTKEIIWIEAIGDYVEIHTADKKFTAHTTMKSLITKLPQNDFMRVHRSYIVRLSSILEIEDNTLAVSREKNKMVPVGKSYRDALLKRLNLI